eukprot:1901607-Rhodomonas_salina.2
MSDTVEARVRAFTDNLHPKFEDALHTSTSREHMKRIADAFTSALVNVVQSNSGTRTEALEAAQTWWTDTTFVEPVQDRMTGKLA